MDAPSQLVAQALSLGGLVAATGEYAAIIRRRADLRRDRAERELAAESGLRALVRIAVADEARQHQEP